MYRRYTDMLRWSGKVMEEWLGWHVGIGGYRG